MHNSHKRYTKEVRDIHHLIYTLIYEGPIFPIYFEEKENLPPYDDHLVVIVKVIHWKVRRVLVDNGSSSDLLYLSTLLDMKIDTKEITQ